MAGDIDIVIGAQDKASAVINAVAGKVGGFGSSLSSMVTPQMAALTGAIAGAAAGFMTLKTAIGAVSAAADRIDALTDTAAGLGETVGELQAFQFAMSEAGNVGAEKSIQALQRIQKTIGEIATGGNAAGGAVFEQLGLDANELSMQGPIDQFNSVREALAGVENVSERASLAQKLLGKSAADLMPALMAQSDEFNASMQAASDLGVVVSEEGAAGIAAMNDAVGRVSAGFEGMANQVAMAVAPLVESIANAIAGWLPPIIDLASQYLPTVVDVMATLVGLGADFYKTMYQAATLDFAGAIETATNALGEEGTAAQLLLKVQEARNAAAAAARENAEKMKAIAAATATAEDESLKKQEAKVSEGEKTIAQLERQLAIAKLGSDEVERQEQLAAAANDAERERIAILQKQLDLQEQANEQAKERAAEEERLAAERKRQGEEITREAEQRESQIAAFRPGGNAVESRLLTRGQGENTGKLMVRLTEQSLAVLQELLGTIQDQDPAASSGGVGLEYIN